VICVIEIDMAVTMESVLKIIVSIIFEYCCDVSQYKVCIPLFKCFFIILKFIVAQANIQLGFLC
jgi:hypothetical protein